MNENPGVRVAVCGALGRMGRTTCEAVNAEEGLLLAAAVDPGFGETGVSLLGPGRDFVDVEAALGALAVDVVVDFTVPASVRGNVLTCLEHQVAVVVGTTGLSEDDLADFGRLAELQRTPVLVAPNFAMGAVLMMEFAKQAARYFRACEIIELHHDQKLDAPSGTSQLTRLRVEETWHEMGLEARVPIHSVRLPGLVAHQEVLFGGLDETLTLRHDSISREAFMPGVMLAVKRVRSLQGLVVGLENIL